MRLAAELEIAQVSIGSTSKWTGRPEYPSYALWLICGLEERAVLGIRSGTHVVDYPVVGRGSGAALMWSPKLDACIAPARRCWVSVIAYQHQARGQLTKASLNRLKAMGFSIDLPAAWLPPRRIPLAIDDALKGGVLYIGHAAPESGLKAKELAERMARRRGHGPELRSR